MTRRTQWLVLLSLGGIWAALALWQIEAVRQPDRVPLKFVSGHTATRESGRGKAAAGLKIRTDLLEAGRKRGEEAVVAPKNIFAPLRSEAPKIASVPRPVKTPASPSPPPLVPVASPAPPPPPSPEDLAAQAARQELAQFRYLGYLNRSDREEAFLSKGKDLHIVKRGDTIDQRVLVKAITPTGVTLLEPKSQVDRIVSLAEGK